MMMTRHPQVDSTRAGYVVATLLLVSGVTLATSAAAAPTLRDQIAAAVAAGEAQHYVKIVSLNTAPGQSQTMTSLAGPGIGMQVLTAVGTGGGDHMTVEYIKHTLYVKATLGFLEGTFGLSSAVAAREVNEWVVVTTNNPAFRTVYSAVTITSALSLFAGAGAVTSGSSTVVDGVRVKVMRVVIPKSPASPAGIETLYIALTGAPLPVEAVFSGGGVTSRMKFSQWGKHFTLRAPTTRLRMPSAQTG
ncbi:MAG: hypothetical protein HKL86_00880 [Acidimicrobiaceae bacterium]|nr:hypothetical protein [Acidimicrobiaceae bacterium]